MARKRELWANLVAPQFGGPVCPITCHVEVTRTASDDFPMFIATRDMRIRRAYFCQEISPDGVKGVSLYNQTTNVLASAQIDSDALAAETSAKFVLVENQTTVKEGEILSLAYGVTTAGSTAPTGCSVTLEVELLELKND